MQTCSIRPRPLAHIHWLTASRPRPLAHGHSPTSIAASHPQRERHRAGPSTRPPGIDLREHAEDFPKDGPILAITDGYCDGVRRGDGEDVASCSR
jgi:hypothetical protein